MYILAIRTIFLVLIMLVGIPAMAKNPPLTLSVVEPVDHITPSGDSMYTVAVTCKKSGQIKKLVESSFLGGLFVAKKTTVSHIIFFSRELPSVVDSKVVMPTLPLALINVFSTDGENEVDGFALCNRSFLISGNRRIFVTSVLNYSKKYKTGPIFKVVDAVTKILTPLATVLGGVPPVAALTGINSSVQQVAQPMQTLLDILNEGENRATPVRLFTGVTTIKTRVGIVTLTTKPIASISEAKNTDFLGDLQTQLSAITTKPKPGAELAQTCNAIAVGLIQSGITAVSDIAYSLVYLSSKELNVSSDLLTCLVNRRYAMAAVKLNPKLFESYPNFNAITSASVDSFYGRQEQPQYVLIAPKLDDLLAYLSQYTRNLPHPPNATKQLELLFAASIVVEDKTSGPLSRFDDSAIKPLQAIDDLSALGFVRFGCYAATSPETGLSADRAVAMFLMFKADAAAKQTTIENVYAVRPFFDGDLRIVRMVLSDRVDWIKIVLAARGHNCNGFVVVTAGA